MEVDIGASTPLSPSTVDEEVYKMERESLELLQELHIQGASGTRRILAKTRSQQSKKEKAKRSVMTEKQNQK